METKYLKKYAPEARREFITAVKNKAAVYGLLPKQILPMKEEGDVVIIGDRPFPRSIAKQRKELEERIKKEGFQQFIEAVAYTWFNRFVAIRYMELHGYLDHGYRVLSHPEGKSAPEILENAERIELPGLNRDAVVDLKLDGGKDEQLYQMLMLAQCNALHKAMPFLFESIKDGTELLLPDNLLHTDSLVRTLVNDIPEEQWQEVEIIGWLYQFYISEKKDEVIGKVVKSEDIPAATQLFTPNWIVKYLVQNSLGRQWMATYPDSPLKQEMEFYIEPAEQTAEVQQQLDEITPDSLNPEELTLLDPACGSGHILVEAYDLFKAIYTERGYRARDIPKLILEKNLYGLEIDDRAAQLAAFALMMKAREDDRGIFLRDVKPQILSIQESKGLDAKEITDALNTPLEDDIADRHISQADVAGLIGLFEHGKTFGSLIRVTEPLAKNLVTISSRMESVISYGGMLEQATVKSLRPLVEQALLLTKEFDAVVANPPYMGNKGMNPLLKTHAKTGFEDTKSDLFAMFIERGFELCRPQHRVAMVTMQSWMFLTSYHRFRSNILSNCTIECLNQMANMVMGIAFGTSATIWRTNRIGDYEGSYSFVGLSDLDHEGTPSPFPPQNRRLTTASENKFKAIEDWPIAYWISTSLVRAFRSGTPMKQVLKPKVGLQTGDNETFLRRWFEVPIDAITFGAASNEDAEADGNKWFPYNKGGSSRRWYGNNEYVINWQRGGEEIRSLTPKSVIRNPQFYFLPSITWGDITTGGFSARLCPQGFLFDVKGSSGFPKQELRLPVLGFLCSHLIQEFMGILNPTSTFQVGDLSRVPWLSSPELEAQVSQIANAAVEISKNDWDNDEISWDFKTLPCLKPACDGTTLQESWNKWSGRSKNQTEELRLLEEKNNRLFAEQYALDDVLSLEVSEDQINLYRPDQGEDSKRLLSYAVGCMMGRYSLDEPGLVYAHSDNEEFDSSKYSTFPADDDGIVPITDIAWFPDDAANRFEEFIKTAWPKEHLEENLTFVAESLDQKKGETSRDCIRRYFATGFFKHHMSMYKKRPIYWLFSSGKQRAFQCLVYLHRYNAGTLSRMRTEYVVPLQGKMNARIEQLESDIPAAKDSTSFRKKLEKERDTLIKQRDELQSFDEKLRHYADQRIELDLDDGVKVNYGKFGDLLAEVKSITGKKPEVIA